MNGSGVDSALHYRYFILIVICACCYSFCLALETCLSVIGERISDDMKYNILIFYAQVCHDIGRNEKIKQIAPQIGELSNKLNRPLTPTE